MIRTSIRDVYLIARFEVLRAVRTWRALALFILYGIAATGAAYLFTRLVKTMENAIARQMGVPETTVPGAMIGELMDSETFRSVLEGMVGSSEAVDDLLGIPILAIFNLWFGFILIPFFAASASAESISIDLQSRAIRYEALRTGRIELVIGRFLGQLGLTAAATLIACVGVAFVGLFLMRGNAPGVLVYWLVWLSVRAWFFSIPFVAMGMATSQLTASPAWSRVMALALTSASWVIFGIARVAQESERFSIPADLVLQLLPQGYMTAMWEPIGWVGSAAVCSLLGGLVLLSTFPIFLRRDL
jgi:ABC-type transport system involved in multi-copper enzyme maturation permease subunit